MNAVMGVYYTRMQLGVCIIHECYYGCVLYTNAVRGVYYTLMQLRVCIIHECC